MLKIPKVSFETVNEMGTKASKDSKGMQKILEEFTSQQPALVAMLSVLSNSVPVLAPVYVASLVWKAIKTECENSVLESFMDDK